MSLRKPVNKGDYRAEKLPIINSFQIYENGVKLSALTKRVAAGIYIDPETNLIGATSTAIFLNGRDEIDTETFIIYTIGFIYAGDKETTIGEANELADALIKDAFKLGSKTVTLNELSIKATYNKEKDLLQFNIIHVKN